MRIRGTLGLALVLGLLSSAPPAFAEDEEFGTRGAYVGVGGLYAFENFDLPSASGTISGVGPVTVKADSSESWGIEGRGGFRFNRWVAVEGQVQRLLDFDIDAEVSGAATGSIDAASLRSYTVTANGKFYPLAGRLQPYLLGGIGFMVLRGEDDLGLGLEETDVNFAGRAGAGFDYYVTEHVALNIETSYLMPVSNLSAFKMIPIAFGAQYHF